MNETDSPLKRLVTTSIVDFAEWILNAKVDHVESANIELHADPAPIFSDMLFWVTLEERDANGDPIRILLHFEFQGASTRKPMRFRILDYIVRISDTLRGFRIHSAVFYIGDGVGEQDSGQHQIKGIGDRVTLAWSYDVIHLWKIPPETLLDLKRPGLLPLIGQTKIENPEELIPQVYAEIKSIPDEETQHRLLTELLALLRDEEIIEMVETLITRDEWVLDTPYIRRWRNQVNEARSQVDEARNQADEARSQVEEARSQVEEERRRAEEALYRAKRAEKAEEQARIQAEKAEERVRIQAEQAERVAEQARIQAEQAEKQARIQEKIFQEEQRRTRRQDLLNLVAVRYNPSMQEGLYLQEYLSTVTEDKKFRKMFEAIINAETIEQFRRLIEVPPAEPDLALAESGI